MPGLRTEIVDYTAQEYWTVAEKLCQAAGFDSYLDALTTVRTWKSIQPQIAQLLDEHHDFVFSRDNIVPRVLFSEFLQFSEDKLRRPEFFCWPGYWLTHATASAPASAELDLWLYHLSLFSDQEHDGRLFARKTRNHDECKVLEVFNQFFAAVVLYDLTRQWVLQNGRFTSDYSWLVLPHQEIEFNEKINAVFEKQYGARLDAFTVLLPPAIPVSRMAT